MFFWIRIFFVVVRSLFKGRSDVLSTSELSLRVSWLEAEVSYANQAAYSHYLELARWRWGVRAAGVGFLLGRGYRFIVAGQIQFFRKPLKRFHQFRVISKIVGWDERWLYFEHRILADGQLAHHAYVRFCCKLGTETVQPVKLLKDLGADPKEDVLLTPGLQSWLDSELSLFPKTPTPMSDF